MSSDSDGHCGTNLAWNVAWAPQTSSKMYAVITSISQQKQPKLRGL